MSAYSQQMSIRKLFAILVAVAVLFAPGLTSASSAYAAVPNHHAQMIDKGHCDPAMDLNQDDPAVMTCCVAVCMAVAVTPSALPTAKPLLGSVPVAGLQEFQTGIPPEIATPPPRAA
ncbi:hypothetical protein [Sphingomonas sp.]|uniref:hypothetical protein n=1 Tax=Sphingomonas sp. TaxID=28214 RepID=UPI0018519CB5|nr:hypothetical protein [Sphingomonas sp.]MBA3511253.1 hypothetical protein [Sphingomonas sp.]